MYFVYILKSLKDSSYYIGHSENLKKILEKHNKGRVRSTKSKRPWQLIYKEFFETRQEVYRRELQIKNYKGGEAFKKLIRGSVPK